MIWPAVLKTKLGIRLSAPSDGGAGGAAPPSIAPRGGSRRKSNVIASAAPGAPARKNAQRQPKRALIAPPSTYPSAEPTGMAA